MAYPGYGGYGAQMPGMATPGMPPQGMPGGPMAGGHMAGGHMAGGHMAGGHMAGGHMPGGHMPGQMGMPMGGAPMGGPPMGGAPMGGVPSSGGYAPYGGAYPNTFGGQQPAANDPMWSHFTAIAGQDGEVDAEELQRCLTQSGFSGSYTPFSLDTCRIMIAMLDRDFTGKMGFNEFKELFQALSGWKQNFMMFDQDRSGTVEAHEMTQAISAMGYRISPPALNAIMKRYNKGGRIYFDDYVACCVKLRALTDNFKRRDTMHQGSVMFQYDDFILCTMAI